MKIWKLEPRFVRHPNGVDKEFVCWVWRSKNYPLLRVESLWIDSMTRAGVRKLLTSGAIQLRNMQVPV